MVRGDDLQILCKDNKKTGYTGCHSIKTLSESHGLSFDEARATKQAIEKNKESVKNVVAFLAEHGYNAAKTKEARREQLVNHFMKENV
ncbi:hypothetical protein D3C81_2141700 [compost metagenome]